MTEDQRRAILDELRVYAGRPTLEANEITAADYADDNGLDHQYAAKLLQELVRSGVMVMRPAVYDPRCKKLVNAYSIRGE
jgi:hypothetical protein